MAYMLQMNLSDDSGMHNSMLMRTRDGKYRGVKGVMTRLRPARAIEHEAERQCKPSDSS